MARRRNISRRRNTVRKPNRSTMRQMARAVSGEPRKYTPPADPPSITRSYHFNTLLEFQVKVADTSGYDPNITIDATGSSVFLGVAYNSTRKSYDTCSLSIADLYSAWELMTRVKSLSSDEVEIALCKAALYGSTTYQGATVALFIDNLTPFASQVVRDTGTPASRPRCGVTMPFKCWYPKVSQQDVLQVDIDDAATLYSISGGKQLGTGTLVGTLQVTVCIRLSAM